MPFDLLTYELAKNAGGGGGGTYDYNELGNQPQINGVLLKGNKTAEDFGLQTLLTAGSNVSITDGVISATDTTYTAGSGIDITNNTIKIDANSVIAMYDNRIADANAWLTNGYVKTSAEIPTANLPSVCTGNDRWGVLLYVAENTENHAGLQQYFPIDGIYKGRVFYRSVTGYSASVPPEFGEWNILPWSSEKQDTISDLDTIRSNANLGSTAVQPAAITDMATKTYTNDTYQPWLGDHGKVPSWKTEDPGAGYAFHIPYNFVFTPDANKIDIKMYTVTADGNNTYNEWDNTLPPANSVAALGNINAGLMTSSDATAVRTTLPNAIQEKSSVSTSATGTAIDTVQYITIDGVEKKLAGGTATLTQDLTTNIAVGGIAAGTTFASGTSVESILRQLLYSEPVGTTYYYTGVVNEIPSSVAGLQSHVADKSTLLTNGTVVEVTTNNQYAVLAIDKSVGLKVKKIEVSGFSMGFNELDLGEQYLYYFDDPTEESQIEYTYTYKEAT